MYVYIPVMHSKAFYKRSIDIQLLYKHDSCYQHIRTSMTVSTYGGCFNLDPLRQ